MTRLLRPSAPKTPVTRAPVSKTKVPLKSITNSPKQSAVPLSSNRPASTIAEAASKIHGSRTYNSPNVRTLQNRLNSHGYHLIVDGDFGPKTKAALASFQRSSRPITKKDKANITRTKNADLARQMLNKGQRR